jgi:anti-sigma B factor antagonist
MGEDYQSEDYAVRHRDGVTVMRLKTPSLSGTLEINRISNELKGMIERGVRKLVVDLKHVEFCGSAALGMLIDVNRRLRTAGGQLVLSHAETIEELLRVSRTASLFTLAPGPQEAIGMLNQSSK